MRSFVTSAVCVIVAFGCADSSSPPGGPQLASGDVRFPSGALELEGTLLAPEGPGPHPAVVLLHDSGAVDRDAAISGQLGMSFGDCSIPVLKGLAELLQAAGYASLRYDKRTCGAFNGCADNAYPEPGADHEVGDLIDDATAAIAWLRAQDGVDRERIYVIGHGEGGALIPRLLTDLPELRGAVMLAAPYWGIDSVLAARAAVYDQIVRESPDATSADWAAGEELRVTARSLNDLHLDMFEGDSIAGVPTVYWQSLLDLSDEAPMLAQQVMQPVLALHGDYDWEVSSTNSAMWAIAFDAFVDEGGSDARELGCVTHALNCVSEPDWLRVEPEDIECHIDRGVQSIIIEFLNAS